MCARQQCSLVFMHGKKASTWHIIVCKGHSLGRSMRSVIHQPFDRNVLTTRESRGKRLAQVLLSRTVGFDYTLEN